MKKRLFLLLVVCFLISILTSCTELKGMEDQYIPETDYPYMFGNSLQVATGNGSYYFRNDGKLYKMDQNSEQPEPQLIDTLYSAPRLRAGSDSLLLQFYQDKLYTIEPKSPQTGPNIQFELVRRDADGKNRHTIMDLLHAPVSAAIHRGYLYYSVAVNDQGQDKQMLLRLALKESSQEPEVLYETHNRDGGISGLIPYGSQIYINEWDKQGIYTMRYNLRNSQVTRLWDNKDEEIPFIKAIYNQRIYFSYYSLPKNDDISEIIDQPAVEMYSSQLNGKDIHLETGIPPAPIIFDTSIDNQYIYVAPTRIDEISDQLKIYKDNQLIQTIRMSADAATPAYQLLIVGDDHYMFMFGTDYSKTYIQYLDKREIEAGTANFKTLLEATSSYR